MAAGKKGNVKKDKKWDEEWDRNWDKCWYDDWNKRKENLNSVKDEKKTRQTKIKNWRDSEDRSTSVSSSNNNIDIKMEGVSRSGTGIAGATGATGATGTTGVTGNTGPATRLRGLQLQLQGAYTALVGRGENVIFDVVIKDRAPFITYDMLTGTIAIQEAGIYCVSWWVSVDGIGNGTDIFITFGIVTSTGEDIRACSPIVTGQVSGNALLEIDATVKNPVILKLVNVTDGTIGFGQTSVKADLTIVNVSV